MKITAMKIRNKNSGSKPSTDKLSLSSLYYNAPCLSRAIPQFYSEAYRINSSNERKFSCAYENDFARSTYYFEKARFFQKGLYFSAYYDIMCLFLSKREFRRDFRDFRRQYFRYGTGFSRKGYTHDVWRSIDLSDCPRSAAPAPVLSHSDTGTAGTPAGTDQ